LSKPEPKLKKEDPNESLSSPKGKEEDIENELKERSTDNSFRDDRTDSSITTYLNTSYSSEKKREFDTSDEKCELFTILD